MKIIRLAFAALGVGLATAAAAAPPDPGAGNIQVVPNVGTIGGRESASFSPDGRILATWDRTHIKLWSIEQGRLLRVMSYWAFIHDLTWAPNSRTLATAHKDGSVKIWDATTGLVSANLKVLPSSDEGPEVWIEGLSFSSDGTRIAAVSQHGAGDVVHVWSVSDQRQLAELPFGNSTDKRSLWGDNAATRFRSGDRQLVASTEDRVHVVDLRTGKVAWSYVLPAVPASAPAKTIETRFGQRFGLHSLVSERAVVAFDYGTGCNVASLVVLDLQTGSTSTVDERPACDRPESQYEFGELKIAVDTSGERLIHWRTGVPGVRTWSLAERRASADVSTLRGLSNELRGFSADLSRAVLIREGSIQVVDGRTGNVVQRFAPHGESAAHIIGANGDRHVLLAGPAEDKEQRRLSLWTADRVGPRKLVAPPLAAQYHHVSHAGDYILASHRDNVLRFLEVPTLREIRRIAIGRGREIISALLSPDEKSILVKHERAVPQVQRNDVGRDEVLVSLVDAQSGRIAFTIAAPSAESNGVSGSAFSADGRLIAVGYWSGEIAVVDARSGRRVRVVGSKEPMDSAVFAIVFTPDNTGVVGCTRDAGAALWRIADGGLVRRFETSQVSGHVNCSALAISADGRLLAAGLAERARSSGDLGAERSIVLWPVDGQGAVRKLEGHESGVGWVAFTSGDRVIVSASYDGTVRHWDRRTGRQLATSSLDRTRNWAMLTSDGFIASSSSRTDVLGVIKGLEHTSLEEVHHALYAPDLVREVLAGDPRGEAATAATAMNLEKVLASGPAPLVGIEDIDSAREAKSDLLTVRATVVGQGKGIGRIEWRLNGITVAVTRAPSSTQSEIALTQQIPLDPGENIIELVAYNATNLLASRAAKAVVQFAGAADRAKPRLHVLAIGIDDYDDPGYLLADGSTLAFGKLNLAVKDATAFADAMSRAAGELYSSVSVRLLRDGEATAEGIDSAVDEMAKAIHPRDTVILFAAGHGTSERGRFYMIPHGYRGGPGSLVLSAVGQDKLQDWVANRLRAKRVVILLDTCESGALIGGHTRARTDLPAAEAAIGRLHESTGRPVLTAAATGQFAHEGVLTTTGERHGVFTWSLLDALKRGDANANGIIELSEIVAHVQAMVPKLAAQFGGDGRAGVAIPEPVMGEQSARFGSRGDDFALVKRID
ncbi:MAG: hypothetical protein R3D27_03475 [Hyphomicrobiaceae bacterium]